MQRARDMATSAALYGQSALRVARRRAAARRRGAPRLRHRLAPLGNDVHRKRARVAARVRRPRRGAAVEGGDPCAASAARRRGGHAPRGRILERVRRLGLARGLRGVEQTPETSFVLHRRPSRLPAGGRRPRDPRRPRRRHVASRARLAQRRADGRRRRGSRLRRARALLGRARARGGVRSRLGRDARGLGVASLRHLGRAVPERTVEVRYEQLVADPAAAAAPVAERARRRRRPRSRRVRPGARPSAGRWRRDLTPEQLADVEREAGEQLVALGYELSSAPA